MQRNFLNLQDLQKVKENLTLALSMPIGKYNYAYVYDEFKMGCSTCTGSCTSCYGSCQGAMKG